MKLIIVVSGMIAAVPGQGGATWAVLQYLLGLRRLGHEVYFVEELAGDALCPLGSRLAESTNAAYFRSVMATYGLEQQATLLLAGTHESVGLPYARLRSRVREANVLFNLAGTLGNEELLESIPVRVYLDLDPGFTQLWHESEGIDMRFAGHTHFVTIGQTIGRPDCLIPTCGLDWITTLQPVVLDYWPRADGITYDALTTIANWRGYGSIRYRGQFYGQKAHSLRAFMTLPILTPERFLLALAIDPGERPDLAALQTHRWGLANPAEVASTPEAYQRFIQGSKAELGIAKSGYAAARSGWFSDRSVCYLASGRPVIAQETGFSDFLPTGEGLFAFETTEAALTCIDALNSNYQRHAQAARALAEEYFESDKVLGRLLHAIGADS